jgi:nitroimidazol reductase NimA-like FMN-containing flavoprotein (pyridoxamine 5'-phosphate oxidase superfamily)
LTPEAGGDRGGELDARFSSPGAKPTEWPQALKELAEAEVFWLSTVRPDGRPHVTPLLSVWHNDALYFSTGPEERKAKNLEQNPYCALTTGRNDLDDTLDIVVEGVAEKIDDEEELRRVADAFESKYGTHFTAPEGTWFGLGDAIRAGDVLLYRVTPTTVLGFGKGRQFSQTRWRF